MSYPKTILTYHVPSEAEIDKSLLESHGITVNLLNANTSRNELGAPFYIQLQVPGEEVEAAVAILKQFNPQRFGSAENVKQIERELARTGLRLAGTIAVFSLVIYFFMPPVGEARVVSALIYGAILGTLGYLVAGLFTKKGSGS